MLKINVVYVELVLSVSRGTCAIFPLSLETECNTERFINYTVFRLCSTLVVLSIAAWHSVVRPIKSSVLARGELVDGYPPAGLTGVAIVAHSNSL